MKTSLWTAPFCFGTLEASFSAPGLGPSDGTVAVGLVGAVMSSMVPFANRSILNRLELSSHRFDDWTKLVDCMTGSGSRRTRRSRQLAHSRQGDRSRPAF